MINIVNETLEAKTSKMVHIPVLLPEVIEFLDLKNKNHIIDATLGLGGHSKAILSQKNFKGKLTGIDQDPKHGNYSTKILEQFSQRFSWVHSNFSQLEEILREKNITFDGILYDLGIASPHVDDPTRGFSYRQEGPLDMRMNPSQQKETAADKLNHSSQEELFTVFKEYGEEPLAYLISKKIIEFRSSKAFKTTNELNEVIKSSYYKKGWKNSKKHPSTRVFQALRIWVNAEIPSIKRSLETAINSIQSGGRIVVISYHSLEDRIVKQLFKQYEKKREKNKYHQHSSFTKSNLHSENSSYIEILTKKPLEPSPEEINQNPRSRSAKMRVVEKL